MCMCVAVSAGSDRSDVEQKVQEAVWGHRFCECTSAKSSWPCGVRVEEVWLGLVRLCVSLPTTGGERAQ